MYENIQKIFDHVFHYYMFDREGPVLFTDEEVAEAIRRSEKDLNIVLSCGEFNECMQDLITELL